MNIILVIPDLHCPFAHKKSKDFLSYIYKHFKCNRVVCLGDELDYHALGKWPVDPNGMSPNLEHQRGVNQLHEILGQFPKIDFLTSNHTVRPIKKAALNGIPSVFLKSYSEFLEAPLGWRWSDQLLIDNVMYFHGEPYSGSGAHINAAKDNRMSCVIGHVHSHAGVQYLKMGHRQETIFGLNAGCLIDTDHYAFNYGKQSRNKPVLGCGVVMNGKSAYFIPME